MIRLASLATLLLLGWTVTATAQDGDAGGGSPETTASTPVQTGVEPLVTTELSDESVVVGQALTLRVSVLVPTWMPSPPTFPAMDIPNVIVRLPERASGPISQKIEGETWSGVSRAYRLYPMVPGPITLPPQTLGITYADPETTQPVEADVTLSGVSITATVPDGAEALDPMILAKGFTLEQTIDGPEGALGEGDAVVRTLVAKIDGTSPLFIPPLIPDLVAEPVQAYPKDARVGETEDRGELSGSRTETVTYVARYGGTVALPDIVIEWFNVESGSIETATVEGMTLQIDAPEAPRDPILSKRQLIVLAGAALVLAAVVWLLRRYVVPPAMRWVAERRAARLASEEHAAKGVKQAIRSQDLQATTNALALWALHFTSDAGVSDALEQSLAAIGRAQYGTGTASTQNRSNWSAVEAAFEADRRARLVQVEATATALPPLNPS